MGTPHLRSSNEVEQVRWIRQQHRGLCHGLPALTSIFFSDTPGGKETRIAKIICKACPIMELCREVHMEETHGVWGATSPLDRKHMRRERDYRLRAV